MGGRLKRRSGRLIRLSTAGIIVYNVSMPLLDLVRQLAVPFGPGPGHAPSAIAVTVCYLPLHLRHVLHSVRGTRPPHAGWSLATMAVVIIGSVPLIGMDSLGGFFSLSLSALLILRPPWCYAAFAAVVAVSVPLALALGATPATATFLTFAATTRALPVFLTLQLLTAIRRLHAARLKMAEEAVVMERLRIDDELGRTVGTALESLVTAAGRAGELVRAQDAPAAEVQLRDLVGASRRTLAEARRMIRGYQRTPLREELDTALTLLAEAGIEVRLVLPPDEPPESLRPALRSALSRLLRDDTVRRCTITITSDGELHLECDPA
ncbi:hypothetical protein ACQPYK_04745 [Streptosporangium sp. CA-135522]|uniref:hypothetical protein n=1 Tax=Streptosporangium sp. CA-135522 TaxID=3240072 RepID=UPI003D8D5EAE